MRDESGDLAVVANASRAADRAADLIANALIAAAGARGRADWVTTGGSTPAGIYDRLAAPPQADRIPWGDIHVWWGDDRYVLPDDPRSNVRPLVEHLLAVGVPLPSANVHPFRGLPSGETDPGIDAAAAATAADLRAARLDENVGVPIVDLVLLGVGPDGHILSVFPGSPALTSPSLAMAIPAPTHVEPHVARVTLNPAIVAAARAVVAVVTGAGKASVLADILGSSIDPARWPAQLARRPGTTWIMDAAAAGLRRADAGGVATDAAAVSDLWLTTFRATYSFPPAHPDDTVRSWLAAEIEAPTRETWLAVGPGAAIVGLMILGPATVEQLYVHPDQQGRGIGSRLMSLARDRRPDGLELYTFEVNERARAFYRRRGFNEIAFGDGSANEERQPDVRMAWRPPDGQRAEDARRERDARPAMEIDAG
ncbi:MAG: 6-phosphogluconolactonase [Chloroflexota bacterium]